MGHRVLFLVETGWRGMREASLALLKTGLSIDVLIKGRVDKEISKLIIRPSNKYRIMSYPRWFFLIYLFFYLLWHKALMDLKTVIVSKKRTSDWVEVFGVNVKLLTEIETGYSLK